MSGAISTSMATPSSSTVGCSFALSLINAMMRTMLGAARLLFGCDGFGLLQSLHDRLESTRHRRFARLFDRRRHIRGRGAEHVEYGQGRDQGILRTRPERVLERLSVCARS